MDKEGLSCKEGLRETIPRRQGGRRWFVLFAWRWRRLGGMGVEDVPHRGLADLPDARLLEFPQDAAQPPAVLLGRSDGGAVEPPRPGDASARTLAARRRLLPVPASSQLTTRFRTCALLLRNRATTRSVPRPSGPCNAGSARGRSPTRDRGRRRPPSQMPPRVGRHTATCDRTARSSTLPETCSQPCCGSGDQRLLPTACHRALETTERETSPGVRVATGWSRSRSGKRRATANRQLRRIGRMNCHGPAPLTRAGPIWHKGCRTRPVTRSASSSCDLAARESAPPATRNNYQPESLRSPRAYRPRISSHMSFHWAHAR